MNSIRKLISCGYIIIFMLIGIIFYCYKHEWQRLESLRKENQATDELRRKINGLNFHLTELSLLGETVMEWNEGEIEHYHEKRIAIDSMLYRFKIIYPAERIDSVRSILADKEHQIRQIIRLLDEQQSIKQKIAKQVPIITQKSIQEHPKKPKRKGFLGIFGKKEDATLTATTTMLYSLNRNVISEQKAKSHQLSILADSLAVRNVELNRQLQELIHQIDEKVQADLQGREIKISLMRKESLMQIGGLTGFVLLLLIISYIIILRDAKRIKQYKYRTAELIEQLKQSVQQNEALIASRKKAVHTITHELRTPLTAISGYAGLMLKERDEDKNGQYIWSIQQSSDRMRYMLNNLLDFFRLDNGKEQPRLLPCRISTIAHTLETEFMPVAMNKGLSLTV